MSAWPWARALYEHPTARCTFPDRNLISAIRSLTKKEAGLVVNGQSLNNLNALCIGMNRVQQVIRGVRHKRRGNARKRRSTFQQPLVSKESSTCEILLPVPIRRNRDDFSLKMFRNRNSQQCIKPGPFPSLEFQMYKGLH